MASTPVEGYQGGTRSRGGVRPERRGVSRATVIEEAKSKVPTIDLADLLCGPTQMGRMGEEWVALCPLPDHEEKTASFAVNPRKNVWYCHGCVRGGDVVELARHAWGYSQREAATAAADLLHEFGHEIPPRPASWYRKQERQAPIRAGVEGARTQIKRRRFFKYLILPAIDEIPDESERRLELARSWADFERLPLR